MSNPSRQYLEQSLVIAQLHQKSLIGDYARVVFKLSEVLKLFGEYREEGVRRATEAGVILSERREISVIGTLEGSEEAYDRLVCFLLR